MTHPSPRFARAGTRSFRAWRLPAAGLVLGLASAGAFAEEQPFEIYGILDLAYGYQANGLPANGNAGGSIISSAYYSSQNPNVGPTTALWSGGLSQNRVGIKGSRSFDGGWRGGYLAETGFNLVTLHLANGAQSLAENSGGTPASWTTTSAGSSQNGQLINREVYVSGGYGAWGDVRAGRNQSVMADAVGPVAPLQNSQIFSLLGNSSSFGGAAGVSETLRLNNSLKYLNRIGDFNVEAMYAMGDGMALTPSGRMFSVGAGYKAHGVTVQSAYTYQTNAIREAQSTTPGAISARLYNSQGWLLGAAYDVNRAWSLQAGVSTYTLTAPSDLSRLPGNTNGFDIAPALSAGLVDGASQTVQLNWLGANYRFAEHWTLSATYQLALYPGYRNGNSATSDGNVNWYAALLNYAYDKKTDVYAAVADIKLSNNAANSAIASGSPIDNNQLMAVGVRYKF